MNTRTPLNLTKVCFFVTIFISFFTCTCYRYKTLIQHQKKKKRKEKPPAKEKNRRVIRYF